MESNVIDLELMEELKREMYNFISEYIKIEKKSKKSPVKLQKIDLEFSYVPNVMIDASRFLIAVIALGKKSISFLQILMKSFLKKRRSFSAEEKFLLPNEDCPEENKIPMSLVCKFGYNAIDNLKDKNIKWQSYSKKSVRNTLAELEEFIMDDKEFRDFVKSLAKRIFSKNSLDNEMANFKDFINQHGEIVSFQTQEKKEVNEF